MSVTLSKTSSLLIEPPVDNPYEFPSEGPEELEEVIAGPSDFPVHPERKPTRRCSLGTPTVTYASHRGSPFNHGS
jgi:hypothetical protein